MPYPVYLPLLRATAITACLSACLSLSGCGGSSTDSAGSTSATSSVATAGGSSS